MDLGVDNLAVIVHLGIMILIFKVYKNKQDSDNDKKD